MLTALSKQGRQTALVCIGGDLGIFKSLAESKAPLSSKQLAEATMADPLLVSPGRSTDL